MRFKKLLIATVLSIGVITPALALAQTTYIKSLLNTVHTLTTGLNGSLTAGNAANIPASCLSLNYTLTLGLTDAKTAGEVSKLQTFLKDQGFFTGTASGYYGQATKTAVGAWQSAQGLAYPGDEGYGSTGPKTRAAIVIRTCSPRNNSTTKPASTLGVAAVAAAVPNPGKNTFYISPSGSDSAACSATAPCATFSKAYTVMKSGDTLIVKNGTYNQLPVINYTVIPPAGTASAYTQIVAETDGGVVIDGKGSMSPIMHDGPPATPISYLLIRGIVFRHQSGGTFLYQADHLKLIRDGFEDASDGNSATVSLGKNVRNSLIEESYAWGSGRYKFLMGGDTVNANNNILRRVVARFDRANPQHDGRSEPIAAFAFYGQINAQCQNCISIDGDHPEFWLYPEEYSGSYSIPSTAGLASNIKITGSIALNVAMQFGTLTKNVDKIVFDNSVGWHIQQASLQRDAGTFSNLTFGDVSGPSRNQAQIGLDHWGGGYHSNPMILQNSILYKIQGVAVTGFDTVNGNVFYGNSSNGSFSGTGNITTTDPKLKYITRTSDSAVPGKGANIINRVGVSGTLWGESGWDQVTSEPLWPFPYEDVMARDMKSYSYSGQTTNGSGSLTGNRGFAALYPASQHPLTDYIWSVNPNLPWPSFTNPIPAEFGGSTPPPPSTTYSLTASATVGGTISPSGLTTVQSGGSQTYTVSPSTGYEITDVKINNVSVGKVTTYTFSNVTSNQTIAATFSAIVVVTPPSTKFVTGDRAQTTASLNVRNTPSTSGTSLGTQASGALGTIVSGPTVANGYNWWNVNYDSGVDGWSIDDYLVKTTTPPPATTYTITASAGAGGSISPSGVSSVTSGSSKTYTITPNSGYQIASVVVNGNSVGKISSYTFSNVTSTQTISVTFSLIPVVTPTTYTITASAGTGGTISPSSAVTVTSGGSATFTIIPTTGYTLSDVKVNGVSVGKVTTYTFSNVVANQSISATFSAVTTTPVPNPSFTTGTRIQVLSTATVRYGASVTQTVTGTQTTGTLGSITNGPKIVDGYVWWNVNFDGNTNDGWTIQDNLALTSATPVTPTTTPPVMTYIITALTGTGGSISPSGSANITSGGSATYTITPGTGYKIADVLVNGSSVGAVSTYTFTNVTSNKTINASFSQVPQFNCPCALLSGTPGTAMDSDTTGVELGMKFTPSVNGTITSIRFYKGGSANKGTHTGKIWTTSGQSLGSVTFTNETTSGWQTATFASPISVSANTNYIVSYYAPSGRYSANNNYFTSAKTVGPLTAPVNAGVYKYGGGFPTETYQSSNYWVDVSFTPSATVAAAPAQDGGIDAWLVSQLSAVIDALEAALKALR